MTERKGSGASDHRTLDYRAQTLAERRGISPEEARTLILEAEEARNARRDEVKQINKELQRIGKKRRQQRREQIKRYNQSWEPVKTTSGGAPGLGMKR